jgi:ribosomal protein S21
MKKKGNISVKPRFPKENAERMIRRFLKKTKKERIIEEVRNRARYKKPSVKKKEKRARAQRARYREEQKRLRAEQRRVRKNK